MGRFGRARMVWVLTLPVLLSGGIWARAGDLRSDVQMVVEGLREQDVRGGRLAHRKYRTQTIIWRDGSINRSVFQAADRTPKEVQDKKVWAAMSYPKEEEPEPVRHSYIFGSRGLFGGMSAKPREAPPGGFFSASGSFPSADKLPQHIRFPSGGEQPDRKLTRESRRTDYVLVTEHTWRETLSEVEKGKRPAAAIRTEKRAREELADLTIKLAERDLTRRLNKRYDTSELVRSLQKEVKPELCGLLEELNEEKVDAIVSRLTRWGLDPQKEFLAQNPERLVAVLSSRVRGSDGKALGREEVMEFANEWFKGATDGITPDEAVRLLKKAAEALPSVSLLQTLTAASSESRYDFYDFQATLPGAIAETNGSLPPPPPPPGGMVGVGALSRLNVIPENHGPPPTLGEATVRWGFSRGQVPKGFSMFVRTLSSDEKLQRKLLKSVPLADKDKAAAYVNLVRTSEPLLVTLRRCRKDDSLQPLMDYRRRLQSTDREEKERVERLLALLEYPPKKR